MIGPFANPVLLPRLRRCAGRPLARAGLALLALVLVAGSAFALAMPIAATPPPQAQESPCHGLPSATEQSDRGPQGGCCEVACACAVLHAALVAPAPATRGLLLAQAPAASAARQPWPHAAMPPLRPPIACVIA